MCVCAFFANFSSLYLVYDKGNGSFFFSLLLLCCFAATTTGNHTFTILIFECRNMNEPANNDNAILPTTTIILFRDIYLQHCEFKPNSFFSSTVCSAFFFVIVVRKERERDCVYEFATTRQTRDIMIGNIASANRTRDLHDIGRNEMIYRVIRE